MFTEARNSIKMMKVFITKKWPSSFYSAFLDGQFWKLFTMKLLSLLFIAVMFSGLSKAGLLTVGNRNRIEESV